MQITQFQQHKSHKPDGLHQNNASSIFQYYNINNFITLFEVSTKNSIMSHILSSWQLSNVWNGEMMMKQWTLWKSEASVSSKYQSILLQYDNRRSQPSQKIKMKLDNWVRMWHSIHCSPNTATFKPFDPLNILHGTTSEMMNLYKCTA